MMHMKNLKNKLINSGIYLSLFAIGFIVAKFYNFPYFEISKSIDLTNVLSLVVTILLAILITTFFEKKNNDHRVEKDLIINRIGNIFEIASTLQIESITGKIPFTEAASSIKRINTALSSIYKIVDKCYFSISDDIKEKIKTNLSDLRETLTNTPKLIEEQIKAADIPIEVKEGIIYFNRDRIAQIEVRFDSLKDLLLELQIEVNRK